MTTQYQQGPVGQNKTHPEDRRNMLVFLAMCVVLFFAYDFFVLKPQHEAQLAKQAADAAVAAKTNTNAQSADGDQGPLTRDEALKASQRVSIENDDLKGSLSLRGGRIDDLALKNYFEDLEKTTPVVLLNPARAPYGLYADFGWLPGADQATALPGSDTQWRVKDGNATLTHEHPVTLTWSNGQGLSFERTYALDDKYMFTVTQSVTNNTKQPVTLYPYALMSRQGLPQDFKPIAVLHEGPIGYIDGHLNEVKYKALDKEPTQSFAGDGWAGFTDKYWFSGIVGGKTDNKANFRFVRAEGKTPEQPTYQVDMVGAQSDIAPGATATTSSSLFVGPKQLDLLSDYAKSLDIPHFDLVIDFGKFWFLTIPFFHLLTWLGHTIGSFAAALLIFTCCLRLAVFPLANKSFRSFARMRKIQPEMQRIREEYGDDRAKLQQMIFELYKRENVNPMAGCLPILIQIPIFFSLYKVLYITLEMRHTPFWGWIHDMSAPDPTTVFNLNGLIPVTLPEALQIGIWPIIMGCTLFMQQRLQPPAQDPVQAKVLSFMPVMMVFMMAHFPAGLVIYWSWSNTLSIIQQAVLMKKEGVEIHFFRRSKADKAMAKAVDEGPNVHPELEVLEHDAIEAEKKIISPPKKGKKGR